MLKKCASGFIRRQGLSAQFAAAGESVGRRGFLRNSGLAFGGAGALAALPLQLVKKAEAANPAVAEGEIVRRKTICPFCAVGCSIWAEVQNGAWIGQEPVFESPVNMGTHCAKGAATRELAIGHRRLKYPTKLQGGQWQRISWEQAIDEIGDRLLKIREKAGPDSVYWLGSAKGSNEMGYLQRKLAAFWGTNNTDDQARICHSTTVAGVANTFGYGAMTNGLNDLQRSKFLMIIGGNPAEAHPVAMLHLLHAKEANGAKLVVVDPRFTRTAAHADEYVRIRSGTDVAFTWGLLWHVFENGWEDKEFIRQRVWGMDEIRKEVANWPPDEVERVTGVPPDQMRRVIQTMVENEPASVIWCMGVTQHHIGSSNTRALCTLQLALGNAGQSGGGTAIFRGHDNIQGLTDLGALSHSLPAYYGLEEGAWQHWARVWDIEYDWLLSRFASKKLMETKGIPVSRWYDGVLEAEENIDQPHNIRAMVFWGHAPNSQTRQPDLKKALETLDTLVIIDPVPTLTAVLGNRTDNTYLLPAGTTMEYAGSVTNTSRMVQWREKVIEPMFEAKTDYEILYLFARKFGFADRMFKNIAVENDEPIAEDITREFNRGSWTIGYTGQSPERLKAHMRYQHLFDSTTTRAESGPVKGDFYGLPWPCWGTPEMRHPGTPVLYDTSKPVADGGLCFRARWGVERGGVSLLADGTAPVGSEIKDGYPEFTMALLQRLGWDEDLTPQERQTIEQIGADLGSVGAVNWKTDLSGGIQRVAILHGCAPFGNGKARSYAWNYPDPVPLHREPLYTPRRDLLPKYRTYDDRHDFRLPVLYWSIQSQDFSDRFPLILTSGRLVEFEGGGDETRANVWLAELQQQMFAEVNPREAEANYIENGDMIWIYGPDGARIRVQALVTRRVGPGVVFMPFHFGGYWQGENLGDRYPEGTVPYVLGEATNTVQTYGYDIFTQMQESKVTLCRIERA
ncbi:formate dehydrogenase subunit alpha [Rhodospirillaceae bacterium SYSU D60014]|uniref:formate dehydrogenase subunit alpha n=1 Tax=Virgifigura deserti TaxID=2268457 RepID=UPI000E674193